MNPQHQQKRKICQSCRLKLYLRPSFIAFFNFSHKRPTFAFTVESGYTLAFANRIAHSGPHAETRAFRTGPLSLPSTRTARPRTSPGRVSERQTLPLWDLGQEVLSKNAESLRDSDALMRVAVPRRRGPAGLRCSVCNLVMLLFFHSARRAFHTCKRGCGITTLGVLRVLSKRWATACQSGSFAIFRGQVVIIDSSGVKCA